MNAISSTNSHHKFSKLLNGILVLILLLVLVSCNFSTPDEDKEGDDSGINKETEIALGVQQTLLAQESSNANATIAAQQATIQAQSVLATSQALQPPVQPPVQPTVPVVIETQPPVVIAQPLPTEQTVQKILHQMILNNG